MKNVRIRLTARRGAALSTAALTGAVALVGFAAGQAGASPAGHSGRDHVALGDSYASAPLVPDQVDTTCFRSSHNYPSLVAAQRHADLTDVSCSGATTAQMTAPQGTAPAQFTALERGTDVVTVSIGGNDIGFSSVIATCAGVTSSDPAGAPCRAHFTSGGSDRLAERVEQTAPRIAEVIRGIHRRSPHAEVLVVGYPDLFPDDGAGCTSSSVPFAAGDFSYLRDTEKKLNSMLAVQARENGARYVDTYTPTIGHDMCRPTGERWIESLAPATPAAPAHPNAQGEQAMATAVARTLSHHHEPHHSHH
ncbi:SGNH/GDSL hydrolase family protein [Streptomyces sp. MI02-7b]|uniref:SGNH/GDSL hydrolase family protein n=1 Tax=Streptomyces sp. MI02-7b TaxID=462941 RepID=UPI0029AF39B7|nr:SGNH/GDSL hydrolase family protein [Streptomyces sp. MI02-7b]MDX3072777.1 SGNH/GDSL hydrolase family protein [Streptomyces sp. MI02-7b]